MLAGESDLGEIVFRDYNLAQAFPFWGHLLGPEPEQQTPAFLSSITPAPASDPQPQLCPVCRQGRLLSQEILLPTAPNMSLKRSRAP